jgi:hypothetical protein
VLCPFLHNALLFLEKNNVLFFDFLLLIYKSLEVATFSVIHLILFGKDGSSATPNWKNIFNDFQIGVSKMELCTVFTK